MKIPDSVRIAGVEYPVLYVEGLNDGAHMLKGQIDHGKHVIRINPNDGNDYQDKCITLLHEILHGLFEVSGIEISEEERVVEMLGRGLYQVLQDNGGRLFDLKEVSHAE